MPNGLAVGVMTGYDLPVLGQTAWNDEDRDRPVGIVDQQGGFFVHVT